MDDDEENEHIAARIVAEWQKDFSRGWRWNNAHRHISKDPRVPLWDDRHWFHPSYDIRTPLINNTFDDKQRQAIARIRRIRRHMRETESNRRRAKNKWWLHNVENARRYQKDYATYRKERMVPGFWMSKAMDLGLTFRHLRENGYRKYIDISDDLTDETLAIDAAVRAQLVAPFEAMDWHAFRPYIFSYE